MTTGLANLMPLDSLSSGKFFVYREELYQVHKTETHAPAGCVWVETIAYNLHDGIKHTFRDSDCVDVQQVEVRFESNEETKPGSFRDLKIGDNFGEMLMKIAEDKALDLYDGTVTNWNLNCVGMLGTVAYVD